MTQEALKLALEALQSADKLINGSGTSGGLVYCMDGYYSDCFDVDPINKQIDEAVAAIKEALAQPERTALQIKKTDPFESARIGDYNRGWNDCLFASGIVKQTQRTWVGLTKDEQSFIYDQVKQIVDSKPFWVRFADAIEAKLKELNT